MRILHKKLLVGILLFGTFFLNTSVVLGQRQPIITAPPLIGDSVKVGKTMTVQDTIYLNPTSLAHIATTKSLDNIVSLYIDEFSSRVVPDSFQVSVQIQVNYTTAGGSTGSRTDTLNINYNKISAYSNKAIKFYKDYYSLQVQVLAVSITGASASVVRPLLVMENMIAVDRNFTTDCAAITSVSSSDSSVSTAGELSVSWPAIAYTPAYDLEWTYIDKSALDSGNYNVGGQPNAALIFKNNSTRLSLTGNSYRIPLLYDGDGSVFFRVRTLQNAPDGEVIAGTWSSESGSGGLGRYDFTGHQRNLNWQATTSYAEEGKRKSVVQYFDGSLKGRQTVTKDNSTQTTVVAETLYDKQGRPVIQVLPAPTLNRLIAYNPMFNIRGINSAEYDKSVYDTLTNGNDYCTGTIDSMSSTIGSSQYYSSLNPLAANANDYHKFVSNAGSYPFTETRYTRDNTGRIDKQGGVGKIFQIGGNRETKYYYASPDQKEIDALFGTEAGDASHYEKNMVRDPNGQYSVSYVDMHGRTVATALAGDAPSTLDQLASYDSITQTDQLITLVNNIIKDNSIQSARSVVVPKRGAYLFHYTLSPESLGLTDCKDSTICYDCLYDLTITINDNCNNAQFNGSPKTVKLSNFSLFKADSVTHNLDTTCLAANVIDFSFTDTLEEGSYDITKVLSLSKEAMNYYRDSIYLPHNTCKSFNQFVLDELDSIRLHTDCTPDSATTNLVTAWRDQMMADLAPLSGQYSDTTTVSPRQCFSIFNTAPNGKYFYQNVIGYLDEDGNPDVVAHFNPVTQQMESVAPQNLSPSEFITNYKDSWGQALITVHPEYKLLLEYEKLKSAYNWESDFTNTQTFAEAKAKGFLNPTGSTTAPASSFTVSGKIDSLFIALGASDPSVVNTAKSAINTALFNYLQNNPGSSPAQYYNIWGLATGIVKCNSSDSLCFKHWNFSANALNSDSLCTGDLDQAWRIFRSQYLKIREDWIDNYTRTKSGITPSMVQPCYPVFPDRNIANYSAGNGYTNYTGTAQDTTIGKANFQQFLYDNCKAYAMKWWQDLAPCGYTQADSGEIVSRLIQVAYEGADKNHPFGSSTVRPSSTNTDRSFEQVIHDYNAVHYPSMDPLTCNGYLIPYPKPYDQPGIITNLPIITSPDSCSCGRINDLYSSYLAQQPLYHSFSNYMALAQGTHISEGALDTLRSLCNNHTTCTYLQNPILLPPAFQCGVGDVCVNCSTVRNWYDSFTVKFPTVVPIADETDTIQRHKNTLFANYMNSHLGFSKTTQEYLSFMAACDSVSPIPSASCDSLQQLKSEYLKIRQEIDNGTVAGGLRLTSAKDEVIESMNGLLEINQGKHLNGTLSSRYAYVAFNNFGTNKLYSLSSHHTTDSFEHYTGICPINAKYVRYPDLQNRIQRFTNAISVSGADFAGATTSADLAKKYYVVGINAFKYTPGFNIWGGSLKGWTGSDTSCHSTILSYWYDFPTPLTKYLDDSVCTDYTCDYYTIYFVQKLSSVSTYGQYTTQLGSGTKYSTPGIKKILSLSWDTTLVRLYKDNGIIDDQLQVDGHLIKAKLLLSDNTEQDAWMTINTCTNVNYIFAEAVDTNIYNADCKKGFAAYYNSKKGTHFTFTQIDSIYLASCGKSLDVCSGNECDSTTWRVYNPGTQMQVGKDMYAGAYNNVTADSLFNGSTFNSPLSSQAGQYVLIDNMDSVSVGSNTVQMKWRLKIDSVSKMVNPFVHRGSNTYSGAIWTKDPADSTWWIGTTTLNGTDGNVIKGIGIESNSHGLKVDWVKLIKASDSSLLYFDDFSFVKGNCPDPTPEITLCGKLAADSEMVLNMDPCADTSFFAVEGAYYFYDIYQKNLKNDFESAYSRKCLDAGKLESFTVTHKLTEYHYTLYYYDQAGNLIKTVPPEGVHPVRRTAWMDSVTTARTQGIVITPLHTLATTYRYNSLNQVIDQHTPDGRESKFWYDRLGRLVVSQNAQQAHDGNYSYTLYDALGRITEVGQKQQATAMTDAIARSQSSLQSWLNYTYTLNSSLVIAEQVTNTVYDVKDDLLGSMVDGSGYIVNKSFQKGYTLRNRVSYTRYYDKLEWNAEDGKIISNYDNSTTYSYDVHGNVDTLVHDYQTGVMYGFGLNRFKTIAYRYDLISGKVNEVHYQPGMPDQFYHRYEYDAENRLTDAYTTDRKQLLRIPVLEEHDARYSYFKHGPLARTVIGQQQVQGIDYAYTLQGWLKGVNSDSIMDADGAVVARDAYRFSLNYFNCDYQAIGSSVFNAFPGHSGYMESYEANNYRPLYNGNISSMIVGIPKLGETKLYNYRYDQLNRITGMDAWKGYNTATMSWIGISKTDEYKERVAYDGNGNILKYLRNGNATQLSMDSLSYAYNRNGQGYLTDNRLRHVKDAVSPGNYPEDIDTQDDDNYGYDSIGNLVKDTKEGISAIEWSVYGKIRKITKADGTTISYTYDVAGNRISKAVTSGETTTTTWYTRDAQGNTMAVYTSTGASLVLSEQHMYGSSRLGVWNRNLNVGSSVVLNNYIFTRGNKFFELSNHLGNVLVTVTDKKLGHDGGSGTIDYYMADVATANDYYPFGMLMPGRRFSAGTGYRYGFNGKEIEKSLSVGGNQYDYGFRIYNPQTARFLSVDPLTSSYPYFTPFQFSGNSPITFIDLDGLEMAWKNPVTGEVKAAGPVNLPIGSRNNNGWILFEPPVKKPAVTAPTAGPPTLKPTLQQGSDNLASLNTEQIRQIVLRTAVIKPKTPSGSSSSTLTSNNPTEYDKRQSAERKDQLEAYNNLADATMDQTAGQLILTNYLTAGNYVSGVIEHGKGVVDGIKDGDYWKAAGNGLLLGLDAAPFIPLKGVGSGLSAAERGIIKEANDILASSEFEVLKNAQKTGTAAEVTIGGRTIAYEPDLPASGATFFDGPFYLGKEAFKSNNELSKTILHELYRLKFQSSTISSEGATVENSSQFANEASQFADKAIQYIKQ